jgi:excinuclease ABC subunit A
LTIRERAVAAWPLAWGGQNLRDILVSLGIDVDIPWKQLPKKTRDWILFTDEQPTVPVYAGYTPREARQALKRREEPSYQGTFTGARKHLLYSFANTQSAMMKKRAARYLLSSSCPACGGKRLRREALSVTFEGYDIAEMTRLPMSRLAAIFRPYVEDEAPTLAKLGKDHPEKAMVVKHIALGLCTRLTVLLDLGLGYLSMERSTPTLSPGELQRLRLAAQVVSNLFGVVYVLDEPSAGLHPADTEALLRALDKLKAAGNSLFVVEHDLDIVRHADWIVDVGPGAGDHGGQILYSGKLDGLAAVTASQTAKYLFHPPRAARTPRCPQRWLKLRSVSRNNLHALDCDLPLGVLTTVTGVSGSGKSSLIAQALVELVTAALGQELESEEAVADPLEQDEVIATEGRIVGGLQGINRLIRVDQKPIGRTPRSNLATYTGLFDHIRKLFAGTESARRRRYDAGRFSFNVAKGRCPHCDGEGSVMVELLFLPSVYAPCPVCQGTRYNEKTLEIRYHDKNIADVLTMTVDVAAEFFAEDDTVAHGLGVLREVGVGYLRLGQPATELSGGEAQRIKLATELWRTRKGNTLYVLDEPTTGLHPSDVEKLIAQLQRLVDGGNTVVTIEHDMRVAAVSDWILDIGPGAGEKGGTIVASGPPLALAGMEKSRTAPYLAHFLA